MKINLTRALGRRADSELVELHDHWVGGDPPVKRRDLLQALRRRMADPTVAATIRAGLDEAPGRVLEVLSVGEAGSRPVAELASQSGLQSRAVRNALDELQRFGLAVSIGRGGGNNGKRAWVIPDEVGEALREGASASGDPRSLLSLSGYLEEHFRRQGKEDGEAARKMYRFLGSENALLARIDGLEDRVRKALQRIVTRQGGIASPRELRSASRGGVEVSELRAAMENASLGTVGDLDLEPFGIRQRGQVIAVFNEAVLAWLRREAKENSVEPATVASVGVDFVSNFSRFTAFVGDQNVRFTVRGTIFKSTGKRMAENLIPNPGREFRRREILDLLYRFALDYRLIDRTGERAFMLTQEGQQFLGLGLEEKQHCILDWLIEDRTLPGDMRHQLPLRRTTLRYLKRLETGVWYDAMFLPFVVRNHYLASLGFEQGKLRDPGSFPVRSSADLQSLAWNLFTWMRKHLYLLGIVDMGYDKSGRAAAIRLTSMGAELLGMLSGRELGGAGHVVVNPDFEVVLFPDENSHALVYELDRFCERELTDSLYHYRITPQSLHRGIAEGMTLDGILDMLQERSRTPLPQNVTFSLESWARSDGMVTLKVDGRLVCDSPEILDRLEQHPEIERLVIEREDRGTLRLKTPVPEDELEGWVRDFGVAFRRAG